MPHSTDTARDTACNSAADRARGFTLVEVMVALAVVAIALPALLVALYQHVDATGYLRDKSLAQMVAANKLEELRLYSLAAQSLPSGEQSGVSTMAGREWYWWLDSEATVTENLFKFTIDVAAAPEQRDQPLYSLEAILSSERQTAVGGAGAGN
jgi:general secretion pathway protein I